MSVCIFFLMFMSMSLCMLDLKGGSMIVCMCVFLFLSMCLFVCVCVCVFLCVVSVYFCLILCVCVLVCKFGCILSVSMKWKRKYVFKKILFHFNDWNSTFVLCDYQKLGICMFNEYKLDWICVFVFLYTFFCIFSVCWYV